MQDQGKRLLLAVALAAGVFLLWNLLVPQDPPKPPPPAAAKEEAPTAPAETAPSGEVAAAPVEEAPRPVEEIKTLTFDKVVATFSSYCGGLRSWRLTGKRYEHDATKGWLLPEKSIMTVTDGAGKTTPVPEDQLTDLPVCGAFEVNFASSTYVIPRNAVWKAEEISNQEIRYSYTSERLEVVKTFLIDPDAYLVRMSVKVNVRPTEGVEARQQLAVIAMGFQDPGTVHAGGGLGGVPSRSWASGTLRDGTLHETDVKGVIAQKRFEPALQWTGFEHPYLLVGLSPRVGPSERVEKYTCAPRTSDEACGARSASSKKTELPIGFMRTELLFPTATFKQGDAPMTAEVVGYLGPKNYDNLEKADTTAGFATGFNKVVDLGWFAFIGRPLLWLLQKFHEFSGNWGISIVLLTFLVKLLTLYWTTKSMRSMKAMASLAPQLKTLQQKYADDRQRQQAETMALYKQHNVNPIAGCLPILLQMPIWLALYRMLSSAGELYQEPLIPGWIDDLTATDPFHVLPAVLVVTMFIQARLQPATGDSRQQKFLQYGMPLMFGVMSFFFPAGLTLYIFTNTVLSALHSIYMNKFDKKSLGIAAQLKKNQDQAAAALAATNAGAKSTAKSGGTAKAKRADDAKATEAMSDDDSAESDEAPAAAGTPGAARNRPRRKKRKR
jgi:YidC/Oxa1 family membrane protein insertase